MAILVDVRERKALRRRWLTRSRLALASSVGSLTFQNGTQRNGSVMLLPACETLAIARRAVSRPFQGLRNGLAYSFFYARRRRYSKYCAQCFPWLRLVPSLHCPDVAAVAQFCAFPRSLSARRWPEHLARRLNRVLQSHGSSGSVRSQRSRLAVMSTRAAAYQY